MRLKKSFIWAIILILIVALLYNLPLLPRSLYGEEKIYIKSITLENTTYFDEPAYKFVISVDQNHEFSQTLPYDFPHVITASGKTKTECVYTFENSTTIYYWDICNANSGFSCTGNYSPCECISGRISCINISRLSNQKTPPMHPRTICGPTNSVKGYYYPLSNSMSFEVNFNLKISNLVVPVVMTSPKTEGYTNFNTYVKIKNQCPLGNEIAVWKNLQGQYSVIKITNFNGTQTAMQIKGEEYAQQYNQTIDNSIIPSEYNCVINGTNVSCEVQYLPNEEIEVYIRKSAIGSPPSPPPNNQTWYYCGDTICEGNKGENYTNCPIDCIQPQENETELLPQEEQKPEPKINLPVIGAIPQTTAIILGIGVGLGAISLLPQLMRMIK